MEAARRIAKTGAKISYPSGVAAEYVRSVVRALLTIIDQQENKGMRDIKEAAARLKDASPEEIQTIAKHDWDMIREVAAVAFAYAPQPEPQPK